MTPYYRVLPPLSNLGNAVCEHFEGNETVQLPKLDGKVFTNAVVDNIHNFCALALIVKTKFPQNKTLHFRPGNFEFLDTQRCIFPHFEMQK